MANILSTPPRVIDAVRIYDSEVLNSFGLSCSMIASGVSYVHNLLDSIDKQLLAAGENRLADLIELANLSAVIGNLLRGGIAKASQGRFVANGPHRYPDLLANERDCRDIEIKVALETNKPKGHLIKPGPHLTARYVLAAADGSFSRGRDNRGNIAWIWEIRVGYLQPAHFSVSNTEGDSGKTAVINAAGMLALQTVYCDLDRCPHPIGGKHYREYSRVFERVLV
jgi:hypothetical protein